jgi:DNA polymerase III sliding clamp (beta) subunit (PCNA family)
MSENSISRATLSKIASLVRPALATQTFIPAYNHIAFTGRRAMAHNDIAAIDVKADLPIRGCLPGELLIKTLASFNGDSVMLQESAKDQSVLVVSGRSKIKLPTMPLNDFPFEMPEFNKAAEIELSKEMVSGIERCLVSAGSDPNHPSSMGVTLDHEDGYATLFATDNFTISLYQTDTKVELPGDAPVILPTFFCNQLISLAKAFPSEQPVLFLLADGLLVEFSNDATLFTKTLVDLTPVDFPKLVRGLVALDGLQKKLTGIPDAFESAFQRALLVQSAELDKTTRVSFDGNQLSLSSSSQMGDADDSFKFDHDGRDCEFLIDPNLVIRGSKTCTSIFLAPKVLVLADPKATFVHIIAHCAEPSKK